MPFILAIPGALFVSEECVGGGAVAASVYERRCLSVTLVSVMGLRGGVKPCLMKRPLGFQNIRLLLSDWLPPGLLGRVSISIGPGAEGGLLTTGIPDQGVRVLEGFVSKLGLTPLLRLLWKEKNKMQVILKPISGFMSYC